MSTPLYTQYAAHANTTFVVDSSEALKAALQGLSGSEGGTILVDAAGGPYNLSVSNFGSADAPILVTSLDAGNPATFASVNLSNASHVIFDNLAFDHSSIGTDFGLADFDIRVSSSDHIEFTNNVMTGTANGMATYEESSNKGGNLALVQASNNVTFAGNVISEYFHGVAVFDSQDVTFVQNEVTAMQGDGFRGGGIEGGVISDNHFHNFYGAIQTITHNDMIQLWGTSVQTENKDILIDGNILDSGAGAATQGIFIRNETFGEGGPASGYFENITITNNTIYNGMPHGINLSDTIGGVVENNTVLWNQDSGFYRDAQTEMRSYGPWINGSNTVNTQFIDNVARQVNLNGVEQHNLNLALNYTDPTSANYVANHIVNHEMGSQATLTDMQISSTSPYHQIYGAQLKLEAPQASEADPVLTPVIVSRLIEGARELLELTAANSMLNGEQIAADEAEFLWTLSDGTQFYGQTVVVDFAGGGSHDVTLDITSPGGLTASVQRVVETRSETLIDQQFGAEYSIPERAVGYIATGDAGFRLDGNSKHVFERADHDMFGLDTLEMALTFKMDQADTAGGSVVRLAGSFSMNTYYHGGFKVRLVTEDGAFEIFAPVGTLADGEFHDIKMSYDGIVGRMALSVDGQIIEEIPASGQTTNGAYHDLILGSSFGSSAEGYIQSFSLSSPKTAAAPDVTAAQENMGDAGSKLASPDADADQPIISPEQEPATGKTPSQEPAIEEQANPEPGSAPFTPLGDIIVKDISVFRQNSSSSEHRLSSSQTDAAWKVNGFLGNNFDAVTSKNATFLSNTVFSEAPTVKVSPFATFGEDTPWALKKLLVELKQLQQSREDAENDENDASELTDLSGPKIVLGELDELAPTKQTVKIWGPVSDSANEGDAIWGLTSAMNDSFAFGQPLNIPDEHDSFLM